jgi:hypothetical protein
VRHVCGIRRRRRALRSTLLAAIVLAGSGALAQGAGATILIQNHTDPAGAPEPFSYHLDLPSGLPPVDFQLRDGGDRSFGPFGGQAMVTEHPPAGWHVADIRCVGQSPADFAPDVPNGRVTIQHHIEAEQICAFTNRPGPAPTPAPPGAVPAPTSSSPAPGLAPAPPTSAVPLITPRRKAAVVRVIPRRRGATARVDIVRRSVIKTQLLWHGRVVGISRVVRPKGTYDVTVRLQPNVARTLQRQGRKRVTMAVRMVVAPRPGSPSVFRYGVIVPL